jgi:alpha-glucosidase
MKTTTDLFKRIRFRGKPLANPKNVIVSGQARFTVLTSRLLRLEWSETGEFVNRGTYAFPTRYGPAVRFTARVDGDVLTLDTGALTLLYAQGGKFNADNLSITFELDGERQVWRPGTPDPANLRGTRRTLDGCPGDAALEEGLLSRAGWALFDDSQAVLFDRQGWVMPRPKHEAQDWYFFGYGHDYKAALAAYARFGGPIPLLPRYALGAWWSRFWAYRAQDLKDLVRDFGVHDLPLDVLVIDMDWHTPHAWTGYTWNRELFPDPPGFLRWVHEQGLRTTLNLHPAQGIQSFEAIYPRFAQAMGVDPDSGEAIPFRITDRKFVRHYFELLHHPMEDEGVDFWWMDWQQGEISEIKGLDPLPWINHLHFHDSTRRGQRPMLYSRWGGLGNHRYYVGFSGDTYVGWPALQFQPYFTATASNVAYGWWSHDIGGHMFGATEPELYARWVQFGALSPCLRLHATKDVLAERRPWKYPDDVYRAAKAAFHWRYQLIPYIYTMARVASDTGLSLCRPMYYEHPQEDAAYAARYQYFFGDQLVAAPIVHPADPQTGLASADVWVPPGTWIDYATKETFNGPRWVRLVGDLDRLPMLVKAGTILPLAPLARTTDAIPQDRLILSVFPGADGVFCLYEDDGVTEAYKTGQHEWTEIKTRAEGQDTWVVEVAPVEGHCDALPTQRQYEVRLEGSQRPERVLVNGRESADWTYDPQTLTTTVQTPLCDKQTPVTVTAVAPGAISALGQARDREVVLSDVRRLLGDRCPADAEDVDAVLRVNAPGRDDAIARLGGPLVRFVDFVTPEEAARQLGRVIVGAPAHADAPYALQVLFTLSRQGKTEQHVVYFEETGDSHIVDTPFAFEGQVETVHWKAAVEIAWKGERLNYTHRGQPLFPSVHAWRALVCEQKKEPLTLKQVLDAAGSANHDLDWETHRQGPEGWRGNLSGLHIVCLSDEYGKQLAAGEPLTGYLATTFTSPDARDAVLAFWSISSTEFPLEFYLNGQRVALDPAEERDLRPRLLHSPRRKTAVMRLRTGENTLLVKTRPPRPGEYIWPSWFFSGAFTTVDGELMTDLGFEE